jgi:exodeoxyribonuclease V alpha subunit
VRAAWDSQKEVKNIMLFLQDHQVSTTLATKIFKTYGKGSIQILRENPFRLPDDIWGIGFKTADKIAAKMGLDHESPYRCRSGLLYILNEFAEDGHCFVRSQELLSQGAVMLQVGMDHLELTLNALLESKDLYMENKNQIYLPFLYFSEKGTAQRLLDIQNTPRVIPITTLESSIAKAEKKSNLIFDEIQRNAIRQALESKIMVLTGGPGTGKTTTTQGILSVFEACHWSVLLAAPTGRAAKRISETTGMEAKTIHRLLESQPPDGYKRNSKNPLVGDVLIVDESSMIDIVLMYNLLKAVPNTMKVIFVGDSDQLPSVGAGNVLRDITSSGAVPVIELKNIYRQAQSSQIIMNAHRINQGKFPILRAGKSSDFFFVEEEDNEKIPSIISDLCLNRLPKYYHIDPIQGIQVLSPMQKGSSGAANLNAVLQGALNPNKDCLKRNGIEYRLGDKVMQIKNNYDKEVFNGDIGRITKIDLQRNELMVTFDGHPIEYDISELDELVLAYATTIHKAQGSEYPIVILPFTMQHYIMLQRNLLYTAITRAKKTLVLVGTQKAIGYAVHNNTVLSRNSNLQQFLQKIPHPRSESTPRFEDSKKSQT